LYRSYASSRNLKSAPQQVDLNVGMDDANEPYYIEVSSTLAGRDAGASAKAKAEELRKAAPWVPLWGGFWTLIPTNVHGESGRRGSRASVLSWRSSLTIGGTSFHDLPIGQRGANVDHLVIGPRGVFSLKHQELERQGLGRRAGPDAQRP
jgi:hypothetical protein